LPKTYKKLYSKICSFENIHDAYLKARRCKRYRNEVLMFSNNLEDNLINLRKELINKTYNTGTYKTFYVYEPKTRKIMALPFKDRVVHHALCNIIEPIFDKTFLYDSYACRIGKGTHAGADRLTQYLRQTKKQYSRVYCLKCDIENYFGSINHNILLNIIKRKIQCPDTIKLIANIINSVDGIRGIPIGNLTSQLFANIYLNELDYMIKHKMKIKRYLRYMDDFTILSSNKSYLWNTLEQIKVFLKNGLFLNLNKKTSIFPISQGIDFLGYRIWATHRLLRKSSRRRMEKKLKLYRILYKENKIHVEQIKSSIASWIGHTSHCNSYNLRKKVLDRVS
jgi:RNA-directed DNA polymerase